MRKWQKQKRSLQNFHKGHLLFFLRMKATYISLFLCFIFQALRAHDPIRIEYTGIIPDSRVVLDYGLPDQYTRAPFMLVFYLLPNGNTIEQTAGKKMQEGDDWHFDIQHIGAQTEFVRRTDTTKNYIVAYLQAQGMAWTSHAAKYSNSYLLYPHLVDSVTAIVNARLKEYNISPVSERALCSHSGGGRFVFNYMAGMDTLPCDLTRIAFIDSNYGYQESLHARKLADWLGQSDSHKLAVIAYVDTTVVLNGKKIVSATGGTGYKTEQMYVDLQKTFPDLTGKLDTCFVSYSGLNGRLILLKKENPGGKIYHTVLVERNGFIHSLLFATPFHEQGYRFWGERAYVPYID